MSWSYRPSLDGLRTVAVYLVLLFHTGLGWAEGGFIGVDLFFVLSGFLVSNVLLSEIARTGGLRIGHFYARRVRRLLPAALVVIVATSLVFLLVSSVVRRLSLVGDAQSALLYVANWRFLGQSGDYFAADIDKSPFLHFWSLAIEEQFYLVFPLLLLLLSKTSPRRMLGVLAGLFAVSLAAQVYWAGVDTNHAYYGTDARLYQLLAGAMLAVAMRIWQVRVAARHAGFVAGAGLTLLLLLGSGAVDATPSLRGMGATVAATMLVGGLMMGEHGALSRLLSRPVPVFLGKISYGTYLWHWPVILVLEEVLVVSPKVIAVLAMAVSTGLAAASYEVLEMPVRTSRYLDRFRWKAAVGGVVCSALVAVTVVPWALEMDRRPALASAGRSTAAVAAVGRVEAIPDNIDWRAVKGDVGAVGSCTADDITACTVVNGSGPHVLLVGDSQAQMLAPMFKKLAQEHDLTLSLNVRAGCMWQEGLDNTKSSLEGRRRCDEARIGWYDDVLPELAPDVVVLVERPRDDEAEWGELVKRRDGVEQPLEQAVFSTTQETLAKISEVVPDTLIVERMIMPETFEPDDCLATAKSVGDCAVPVPMDTARSDAYYIAAAAESPAISTVNLNPALCPGAPVCLPVVKGRVVWRDDHHFTAEYALHRRARVWKLLTDTGVFDVAS